MSTNSWKIQSVVVELSMDFCFIIGDSTILNCQNMKSNLSYKARVSEQIWINLTKNLLGS